jgi:hypothetical protein
MDNNLPVNNPILPLQPNVLSLDSPDPLAVPPGEIPVSLEANLAANTLTPLQGGSGAL